MTTGGAVGVLLGAGAGVEVEPVVSQGCPSLRERADRHRVRRAAWSTGLPDDRPCSASSSRPNGPSGPRLAGIGSNGLLPRATHRRADRRPQVRGTFWCGRWSASTDRAAPSPSTTASRSAAPCASACATPARPTTSSPSSSAGCRADAALAFVCTARGSRLFDARHRDTTHHRAGDRTRSGRRDVLGWRDRSRRRAVVPPDQLGDPCPPPRPEGVSSQQVGAACPAGYGR